MWETLGTIHQVSNPKSEEYMRSSDQGRIQCSRVCDFVELAMTIRRKTADNRLGGITLNISRRGERWPLFVFFRVRIVAGIRRSITP